MTICKHTGRVRPVVWKIIQDGHEMPATVVCEQCWKPIAANAVAHTAYEETEDSDGWYSPVETARVI